MPKLVEKSRLFIAAFGFVLAVVYATAASRLSVPAFSDPVGPRMFPYALAIALCIASVLLIVEHFVLERRRHGAALEATEADGVTRVAIVALALLTAYYVVFDFLGFLVSTVLFLVAFLSFSNRDQWKTNVIVAVLFPLGIYLLLDRLFGARLPAGIIEFG
jgi:putative tricarboxylic transport membrane protein